MVSTSVTPSTENYSAVSRSRALPAVQSRPSLVRLGSLPQNSAQDLRFVQDRMALLGKTTFLISTMFLVATSLADLAHEAKRFTALSRTSHVIGTLIAFALWQLARSRRPLAPSSLQLLDVVGTVGICAAFSAMGHFGIQPYAFYTGLLAVTHVNVSRAMVVPSVPQQTLLLGVLSFAGLVASRAITAIPPELAHLAGSRSRGVIEAALWSMAGFAVTTVASKVIYGLHEKAREARRLGQYALEEKIGEGGMGEIYRARHAMLRRPTAVKLLSGEGSEEQLRRFEKEVQLTARLTHPNTISIYDYGRTPDGVFYYAMELLEGVTLEELVTRHGPQPASRVVHILLQVCGALNEAHRIGLIHRDIKPANIFLCRRGDIPDVVKVLDFGLVREIKSDGDLTRSNINAIVGTPLYLPPEAIVSPQSIDARADIYCLGTVAYFLLTGTTPFTGNNVVELCAHHLHTEPPAPSSRANVPADLERIVLACLAKDREARPQSARALAEALQQCADAYAWREPDAERWWACSGILAERPAVAVGATPQPLRTICCADLEQRLGALEKTG